MKMQILFIFSWLNFIVSFFAAPSTSIDNAATPTFKLIPAPKITFNSFVDCNMAEVLNLVNPNDILSFKYKISRFPDGQQSSQPGI